MALDQSRCPNFATKRHARLLCVIMCWIRVVVVSLIYVIVYFTVILDLGGLRVENRGFKSHATEVSILLGSFLGNRTSYRDDQRHYGTITTSATHCIVSIRIKC